MEASCYQTRLCDCERETPMRGLVRGERDSAQGERDSAQGAARGGGDPAQGAPLPTGGSPVCLETRGLAVGYDGPALVSDIALAVRPGQIVTLIGPNGAGKSTILKSVAGHLAPLGGAVFVSGKPLSAMSSHELALELSLLLTDRLRTELLTCQDVVEAGRYPHTGRFGILSDDDRAAVRAAMEAARVWELRDRDFMLVSDGQRQRVLLARAICQQPRIMVLDEPTSYLDIRYQIELLSVLRRIAAESGVGVLMALHELPLACKASDYVVCVKDDAVFAQGTPDEIFVPAVIDELYDLEPGTFDPVTGSVRIESGRTSRALPR